MTSSLWFAESNRNSSHGGTRECEFPILVTGKAPKISVYTQYTATLEKLWLAFLVLKVFRYSKGFWLVVRTPPDCQLLNKWTRRSHKTRSDTEGDTMFWREKWMPLNRGTNVEPFVPLPYNPPPSVHPEHVQPCRQITATVVFCHNVNKNL